MLLMRAHVGELVLVLGLLVSARCEVRARDPEVEEGEEGGEEEEEVVLMAGGGLRGGGGRGSSAHPLLPRGARPVHQRPPLNAPPLPEETAPPTGEEGSYPARTGNWCAFVQKRVVTMAVACGTEKYTIKSQSPCPNGTPDCQLVMYKLSTRPVYRQKQNIFTALLWRCCPGHGGENCEETVIDGHLSHSEDSFLIGQSEPGRTEARAPAVQARLQSDLDQEQNDFQVVPVTTSLSHGDADVHHNDTALSEAELTAGPTHDHHPGHAHHPHGSTHDPRHDHAHNADPHLHHGSHQQPVSSINNLHSPEVDDAGPLPYPPLASTPPPPHMMALIMSQLQPVFEGFNRTLEALTRQVGDLSRDVAHIRSTHHQGPDQGLDVRRETPPGGGGGHAMEGWVNTKLDEIHSEINEVGRRMHSQHAMLHYNLTVFKTEVDLKLKRNHKLLQANLQVMNATMAEMRLDQEQLAEDLQAGRVTPPPASPTHPHVPQEQTHTDHLPPMNLTTVWTAIERLNDKVVNNTVKVDGLVEDLDTTSGDVTEVRSMLVGLEERIAQTGRNSQIQFMETGLEVEAAKVSVMNRFNELAGNASEQNRRLAMLDEDVDDLYSLLYKNTTSDCDCRALRSDMALLQVGLANVTELANDNRLALEGGGADMGAAAHWEDVGAWQPLMEDLQQGLRQVKDSLAFEQERTRTLSRDVTHLGGSLAGSEADVSSLRDSQGQLAEDMRRLSSSFQSLLQDAMRHTDVLERLLGEEVLEFLDRPIQDQEDRLADLHDKLLGGGVREDSPAADQPSSWYTPDGSRGGGAGHARERQVLHRDGEEVYGRVDEGFVSPGDGGDLWNLERSVEELEVKIRRLEERPCCSALNGSKDNSKDAAPVPPSGNKLQAEVMWLQRALEDHLRIFKDVFSNADVLAASDAMTLDLEELWALLRKKKSKELGKRQKRKGAGVEKKEAAATTTQNQQGFSRNGGGPRSKREQDPPPGLEQRESCVTRCRNSPENTKCMVQCA